MGGGGGDRGWEEGRGGRLELGGSRSLSSSMWRGLRKQQPGGIVSDHQCSSWVCDELASRV